MLLFFTFHLLLFQSVFVSRLAEARRHRWLRQARRKAANNDTVQASFIVVIVQNVDPESALKELALSYAAIFYTVSTANSGKTEEHTQQGKGKISHKCLKVFHEYLHLQWHTLNT